MTALCKCTSAAEYKKYFSILPFYSEYIKYIWKEKFPVAYSNL